MATQQGAPTRPLFRLATIVRPPPPQQPDQPPPPPPPRPASAFTRAAPPPQPPAVIRAPSPTPTSPPSRAISPSIRTVKPLSPATINNPPLSHPPSPLALPSPQLKSSYHPDHDQYNSSPKIDTPKKPETKDDDIGMIITISGENKGAIMDLGKFAGNYVKKNSSDGEKSEENKKNHKPLIMNSNVQGVNNSIIYNCSITHHDPGLHLSLSTNPPTASGRHHT